jgi:hypothetical protein
VMNRGLCGFPGMSRWIGRNVQRVGGAAAQKAFLVRTDWAQFRFSLKHKGLNPYENVLSPATVGISICTGAF